ELPAGTLMGTTKVSKRLRAFRFSPNGQLLAAGTPSREIEVWQTLNGRLAPYGSCPGYNGYLNEIAFSPEGHLVGSGSHDSSGRVCNPAMGEIRVVGKHNGPVFKAVFSPDGRSIASAGTDATVRLWTLDGRPLALFRGHQGTVFDLAFTATGSLLSVSADK